MARRGADGIALAERFVREARQALLDGTPITASAADVLVIVRSWPARKRVLADIRTNDRQLVAEAAEFLSEMAKELERSAKGDDRLAALIERAGLSVAGSLTAGGVGLMITLGATLGPLGMFAGGLVGLAICGTGRHVLAVRSDGRRDDAADIRSFVAELKAAQEKD